MSDLVLDAIKSFLYERQEPEEGLLDGRFYMFKGHILMKPGINFHKSIYPTYLIIERHRGPKNRIYYKVFVNKTENEVLLIRDKKKCEHQFFKKPMGAIFLIQNILRKIPNDNFSFIIEGNSFAPVIVHLDRMYDNYTIIQDALVYYENIDFEVHQLYNDVVA
jgi:hypothetical protein